MSRPRPLPGQVARRMWHNRPSTMDVLISLIVILAARYLFGLPVLALLGGALMVAVGVTAVISLRELQAPPVRGEGGGADG
ncbi:hypothetical protein ACIBG4_40890 [Nonomuraea sp. NPDC050383]|uniref:hypothetical protein n=1 Tax=Nonomuraea sp. NPDC050383 TaxID=3364362 RepID=UPI003791A2FE